MRAWIPALVVTLALPGMSGAAEFVNPSNGYRADIPEGFQHRYDPKTDTLWLAARGGMRVRIESNQDPGALDTAAVGAWYKRDGIALKKSTSEFQVVRKPTEDEHFGKDNPGFAYVFGYAPGPSRAMAYLADGPAGKGTARLQVRLLAYGPVRALKAHDEALAALMMSFRWPAVTDDGPATDAGGTQLAAVTPGGGTKPIAVDPGAPPSPRSDGGPSTSYRPTGDFSRGSLSGGLGAMGNAGLRRDEKVRAALDARYSDKGETRNAAQRKAAAGYLGFQKK